MPRPFSAIPGPKGFPIIGNVLEYTRFGKHSFDRMHLAKQANFQKYGKIYKERIGLNVVHLFDPEDIEQVYRSDGKFPFRPPLPVIESACRRDKIPLGFGSMNGEPWWRVRKAVQGTMMPPSAGFPYLPIQNDVGDDLVKFINRQIDDRGRVKENLTDFLQKYTMEAFGAVCFNTRIGCMKPSIDKDSEAFQVIESVHDMFEAMQKTAYGLPTHAIYPTKYYKQYVTSTNTSHRIAHTYVDNALKAKDGQKKANFLKTLVDSHSERLTLDEMTTLTVDLFTAGIDSTAFALSFCLYNLAKNVEKQNRLIQEIDSVLGKNSDSSSSSSSSSPVTSEMLNQMPYLKACVKESFRMNFPVEGGTIRKLASDMVLSDYQVPKGTLVSFNHQTMCLASEYIDKPDQYLPERWMREESETFRALHKFVMLPFGHGSRMCIGRRFAEQEIYLALIKILRQYRLQLDEQSGKHPKIGMINFLFTKPDGPIQLRFIRRQGDATL